MRFTGHSSITLAISMPLALMGCGSSTQGPTQMYHSLDQVTPDTSQLIGRMRGLSDAVAVGANYHSFEGTGTLDHSTGAITFEGITDSDGIDANGNLIADGLTIPVSTPTVEFTGTYDFVRPYQGAFPFGGAEGFYGVGTALADMPTTGSATFAGEASGYAPNGIWVGAPTTITANFGPSTGTLDLDANQTLGGVPVTITVTGATITGNAINGGTITATENGNPINVTTGGILGPVSNVDGYFYGYDTVNNTPDEIGIELGADGAEGYFDLTILAD